MERNQEVSSVSDSSGERHLLGLAGKHIYEPGKVCITEINLEFQFIDAI